MQKLCAFSPVFKHALTPEASADIKDSESMKEKVARSCQNLISLALMNCQITRH